jgi:RluA family pseudouridine synthase
MNNISIDILYRDGLILVINKPGGIPVHKGSGGGETLEDYFETLQFGLPHPPVLAHRLDKDTSGCLVLARNKEGAKRMGKLFENDQISKTYIAVVHGIPENNAGIINFPLGKQSTRKNSWWMKVDLENGKEAITHYTVLKTFESFSVLQLNPQTGRTHQLRVHCEALGHPILGDSIYGKEKNIPLHLHALSIKIPLNPKKESIFAQAPLPDFWGEYNVIGEPLTKNS